MSNQTLIPKARVSKKWHEVVRRILLKRDSNSEKIAATLHNRRYTVFSLRIDAVPVKVIAKRMHYLYVAYNNARIYRFNLINKIPDRFYLIPHDWTSIRLKGNFLIAKTSSTRHHFIHMATEKTHFEVGKKYSAWDDWIIFMNNDLGIFHFFEKIPAVFHRNVHIKPRFFKVIDSRLYTYTDTKVAVFDLQTRRLLLKKRFDGILSILKWKGRISIRYLSRDLSGKRIVVYQALYENVIEKILIHNAYRLLDSPQSILFAIDPNLGLLVGDGIYVKAAAPLPLNEKIYRFGPFILFSSAKIYKIAKGSLKLFKKANGLFVLDGTLIILKNKETLVFDLAKEAIFPLK